MADNKYLKTNDSKLPVEKEKIEPIVEASLKKKSLGSKIKGFFFSGDAREVRNFIVTDTIIPAIKDGIYEVITGFIDGMLYGDDAYGGSRKRRRRSGGSSYEKSSYTNYYKTSSRDRDRDRDHERDRDRATSLDLDNIEFCNPDYSAAENRAKAKAVKEGMLRRIEMYEDGATVQDLYEFCRITCRDWKASDWGWTDADEWERECYIRNVRGGAIMSVPSPKPVDN